jgi:hypothetical protein
MLTGPKTVANKASELAPDFAKQGSSVSHTRMYTLYRYPKTTFVLVQLLQQCRHAEPTQQHIGSVRRSFSTQCWLLCVIIAFGTLYVAARACNRLSQLE